MGDFPDWVARGGPAVSNVSGLHALGVSAVLALLDGRAAGLCRVLCEVILAALLGDAVGLGKCIDTAWVSSVAGSSSLAVDDNLRRECHIGPGSVPRDVDPISD